MNGKGTWRGRPVSPGSVVAHVRRLLECDSRDWFEYAASLTVSTISWGSEIVLRSAPAAEVPDQTASVPEGKKEARSA